MEGVLITILCFGILSVLIALLFRGNNKSKRKEYIDTLSKIYSVTGKYIDEAYHYGKNGIYNVQTSNEIKDRLDAEIMIIIQQEKALSYKEGFWNGQKAKIEEVKFSDKDALSKDEIEDIKQALKQQDYTNHLS